MGTFLSEQRLSSNYRSYDINVNEASPAEKIVVNLLRITISRDVTTEDLVDFETSTRQFRKWMGRKLLKEAVVAEKGQGTPAWLLLAR